MNALGTTAVVLAAVMPLPVSARPAAATDPAAPVPALRYESAFADYRRDEDITRTDWRAVNRVVDEAARRGAGHADHHPAGASRPADPNSGHRGDAK